jgi:uncharacterized protein YutE (UPF0331/DUF86 family)
MTRDKLGHFMESFVAAVQLLQRSGVNGFLVEYVCLAASVVDGALRIALILQHQLETASTAVLDKLLFQSDEDRIISERAIYRRALDCGVIDQLIFDRLENLYTKRNRVIHRYVISEITTKQVFEIARGFEEIIPVISGVTGRLEAEQIRRGVGMTRAGSLEDKSFSFDEMSAKKHGDSTLAYGFSKKAT